MSIFHCHNPFFNGRINNKWVCLGLFHPTYQGESYNVKNVGVPSPIWVGTMWVPLVPGSQAKEKIQLGGESSAVDGGRSSTRWALSPTSYPILKTIASGLTESKVCKVSNAVSFSGNLPRSSKQFQRFPCVFCRVMVPLSIKNV